ncbi:Tat (twin-arginine translocation) pathway signal sequence [Agromyces sp. CFH 90414]|uniref:Tat (Twin-arginine translocation) pathway signal sequence n=1 Tax=Agromyces agglutinans TaxID=2662258 RepID=A0A6I2F3X4_9MICO|nr:M14 family zinc carboxypeptidase [Agromyces agglutinans]MRG59282.1 Tat (twin-arginine translocation) pathway signal sequence [Agromyces agglutinans]
MHIGVTPHHRRRTTLITAAAVVALAAPLTAAAPAIADANFPSPNGNTNISSIVTYDDLIAELEKLEKTSRFGVDVFTLEEAGTAVTDSEQGRDLYVATVGDGPEHVWLQGRIHGNEPYGTESLLAVLKDLGSNGSPESTLLRETYTFHVIPMYNPDGSELNIRHTILQDGSEQRIDLNRDWGVGKFAADESLAFYEYWTMVDPAFAVDIHHQGLKTEYGTGDEVTLSLGISLAPGGPTLPGIQGGAYDVLTRQMHVHVYDELQRAGFVNMDRYQVGGSLEIDIKGGVVSAMMLGLNHDGLNPEGHSNPAIFFETSGNTSDGSLGQKARGKSIQQNVRALNELLVGMATGEVQQEDPARWEEIPHAPVTGYQTDDGVIPASY